MTIYAIIITLFALLMWWRKRVWKRRFMALVSTEGKRVIDAFAQMWGESMRDQMAQRRGDDEWPEMISDQIQ